MSDDNDEKKPRDDRGDRRPRRDDSGKPSSGRPSGGRPNSGRSGAPRNDRPARDGERKPYNRDGQRPARDGERKPYNRDGARPARDGQRPARDGERKPYSRDGQRPARDGERKPYSRDGQRPARDGERKPYSRDGQRPARDGERKPYSRDGQRPARDGERKPYNRDGARPARDGERKPYSRDGARPARDGDRKPPFNRDGRPPARGPREEMPPEEFPRFRMSEEQRKAIRDKEPEIENWIAGKGLDKGVIRDLSTLSEDNAMVVGRHLEAAGIYAESDPERALQHAIAAKNRASRLAIVRETVGIMAYVNQDFTLALSELRTAQRISGSNEQAALIIDCLRALDRTDEGLKIARGLDRTKLPRESRIDLAIVLSGIRLDRGETDRAFAELQIPELDPTNATPESAQLFDANAEVLEELGRVDEAEKWRKYARMTEAHFTPDETIEFHTEYLETPTDVTDDDGAEAAGETPVEEQS